MRLCKLGIQSQGMVYGFLRQRLCFDKPFRTATHHHRYRQASI